MGTFHHDKHELHGITVVVDTAGPSLYVGRCDDVDDQSVILLDADVHEEGAGKGSKEEYLRRAAKVGVWKKLDRIAIPLAEVATLRRLADYSR
ncbi:MAG: hypothetical protein ACT4PV_08965 [Planctomycetaceae bacterium]